MAALYRAAWRASRLTIRSAQYRPMRPPSTPRPPAGGVDDAMTTGRIRSVSAVFPPCGRQNTAPHPDPFRSEEAGFSGWQLPVHGLPQNRNYRTIQVHASNSLVLQRCERARSRIRTDDLLFTRQLLWPTELFGQVTIVGRSAGVDSHAFEADGQTVGESSTVSAKVSERWWMPRHRATSAWRRASSQPSSEPISAAAASSDPPTGCWVNHARAPRRTQ